MSRSTLHDKEILENTYHSKLNTEGHTQFNYKLPSGRVVTSEWITTEQANSGKVIIRWVDRMREEDSFDKAEEEERQRIAGAKKQTQRSSLDVPSSKGVPAESSTSELPSTSPKESGGLPDDPDQMIRDKVTDLLVLRGSLTTQIEVLQQEHLKATYNADKWKAIAKGLGISMYPPTKRSLKEPLATSENLEENLPTPPKKRRRRTKRKPKET